MQKILEPAKNEKYGKAKSTEEVKSRRDSIATGQIISLMFGMAAVQVLVTG